MCLVIYCVHSYDKILSIYCIVDYTAGALYSFNVGPLHSGKFVISCDFNMCGHLANTTYVRCKYVYFVDCLLLWAIFIVAPFCFSYCIYLFLFLFF